MFEAISIGVLTASYLLLYQGIRRCKLMSVWLVFGVIPAILAPLWAWANDFDSFLWLKMFSVFAGVCWAGWIRFGCSGRIAWFRCVVPWILFVNVAEAMLVDLLQASFEHIVNASAAIALMLTIPFRENGVRVEQAAGFNDLHVDLPRTWLVGYTLWNWSFVMLNYPAYAGHHMAILIAALIVGWIEPKMWLQARSATLGLNLLCYATNPNSLLSIHNASSWTDCSFLRLAPCLTCVWILIASLHGINHATDKCPNAILLKMLKPNLATSGLRGSRGVRDWI